MDKRRLILLVLMVILVPLIFLQLRAMGTPSAPPPTPVQQTAEVVEKVQYTDILVATTDISFGTTLNDSHMGWRPWPAEAVKSTHITKRGNKEALEEFIGGVTRVEFYADDPISERKIVMPGEKSVMAALLNPGMRAVTTRISVDTAAGGFIQPGDNVDIILTSTVAGLQNGPSTGTKRYVAQTIFENVRVLAIDQTISNDGENGASVIGSTATFEMTQKDSEILQQSVAQGDLSLTLRPLGRGSVPGKSHATVKTSTGEVSSLVIYRDGQPTQVAIRGQ